MVSSGPAGKPHTLAAYYAVAHINKIRDQTWKKSTKLFFSWFSFQKLNCEKLVWWNFSLPKIFQIDSKFIMKKFTNYYVSPLYFWEGKISNSWVNNVVLSCKTDSAYFLFMNWMHIMTFMIVSIMLLKVTRVTLNTYNALIKNVGKSKLFNHNFLPNLYKLWLLID